ncbi:MAG: hypothetical protein JRC77_09710 [Deltaproteobacteria bacterium]|nr:hypothetical protein [Deltaproteobacteria bacterium]
MACCLLLPLTSQARKRESVERDQWLPVQDIPNQVSFVSDHCDGISLDVRVYYIVRGQDLSLSHKLLDFLNNGPRTLPESKTLVLEVEIEGVSTRYDLTPESVTVRSVTAKPVPAPEQIRFEGEGGVPWIAPKYSKYLYAFLVSKEVGNVVDISVPDREGVCKVPPLVLRPLRSYGPAK